tara:strand:- start:390 stop:1184 length:795 start_codon:yes stop_codon:yes gene_type:complete
MHFRNNYQKYIWLLSGTGEGPEIARTFLRNGWKVSVSVVSDHAAFAYFGIPLEDLWIGPLKGVTEIKKVLLGRKILNKSFDLVLDATHPFAQRITADLNKACNESNQHIVRLIRPLSSPPWANYISDISEISKFSFVGKSFLFAIGSRSLLKGARLVRQAGAEPFARILPTPKSIRLALSSDIASSHLAPLRPFQCSNNGEIETALCRKWSITSVLCRQSGGKTQQIWEEICLNNDLDLWLISRPIEPEGMQVIYSIDDALKKY